MDITFKTPHGKFNYRVCGMIINENRILAMHDERSPYYYLPGGRVKFGESAEEAVVREMKEELGAEVEIIRPLWLNQCFFTEDVSGEQFHEICIYFLMDISKTDILTRGEMFTQRDNGQMLSFEWLEFDRLKDEYFYPIFLKEKIWDIPNEFSIIETAE